MAYYYYKSIIGEDRIRLMILEPGKGDDPISCKLQHTCLERGQPPYEAVSYTWGKPTLNFEIVCQGAKLIVTKNLYQLLHRLRRKDTGRVLWADAVCINQKDITERNQQVRIMRDIYQSAQRTLIWLGNSVPSDELAFHTLDEIYKAISGRPTTLQERIQYMLHILDRSEGATKALHSLLQRTWFQRVWVLQEVGVSHNVTVICGEHMMDWDSFEGALLTIHHLTDLRLSIGGPADALSRIGIIEYIRISQLEPASPVNSHLAHLLRLGIHSKATDPRDLVYALLGLVNGSDVSVPQIDYALGIEEVYKRAAMSCLASGEPYLILSLVSADESFPQLKLPSWVPDFSNLSFETTYSDIGSEFFHAGTYPSIHDVSTSPTILHRYEGSNTEILVLKGKSIGCIKKVIRALDYLPPPREPKYLYSAQVRNKKEGMHAWFEASYKLTAEADPYPTGEAIEDVRWRTAVCDFAVLSNGRYSKAGQEYSSHYKAFCKSWGLLSEIQSQPLKGDNVQQQKQTRFVESSIAVANLGMNFCLTDEGLLG